MKQHKLLVYGKPRFLSLSLSQRQISAPTLVQVYIILSVRLFQAKICNIKGLSLYLPWVNKNKHSPVLYFGDCCTRFIDIHLKPALGHLACQKLLSWLDCIQLKALRPDGNYTNYEDLNGRIESLHEYQLYRLVSDSLGELPNDLHGSCQFLRLLLLS